LVKGAFFLHSHSLPCAKGGGPRIAVEGLEFQASWRVFLIQSEEIKIKNGYVKGIQAFLKQKIKWYI